jgi:hypothetical protein
LIIDPMNESNQPTRELLILTLTDRAVCETAVVLLGQKFMRAELVKKKKSARLDSLPLQRGARN